jgi:hypothetical protein
LVILNHPDRNLSPQATARMQEINEAYDVIGDQNKRTKYDFESLNSTTTSQTTDSSYAETANLQEFSSEENFVPASEWVYFFLVITVVCMAMTMSLFFSFPTLTDWFIKLQLSPLVTLLVIPVGLLGISSIIISWKSSKSAEKESQCPKCGKVWAAEKLSEKLMGIFRKALGRIRRTGVSFITCGKYKIHYKCKYCSYEWLFIKIRKV